MKSVPLAGKGTISFFPDDTIETIQQHVALAMNSHPDRLFILAKVVLPANYYSGDPRNWKTLFRRMSVDGATIPAETMAVYLNLIRPGTGVVARAWTLEQWENEPEAGLLNSDRDVYEWRILGVEEDRSWVLPLPPRDTNVPAARTPVPRKTGLLETVHPYAIAELQAVEARADDTARVRAVYFPNLTEGTPTNIEALRSAIEGSQKKLTDLLALRPPVHTGVSVLRAKWYVPWVSTQFPRKAARTRFEQIFYGMTVSEKTPHIAFFTGKDDAVRHKFYVKDPKSKTPLLPTETLKTWYSTTQPQRRLPTLLLYRPHGDGFDRIAITNYDVTLSSVQTKKSKKSLDDIRENLDEWIRSLDALMPFVRESDLDASRWELNQLTAQAYYSKEVREYDLRRFGCLRSVFEENQGKFVLLRADTGTNLTPQEFQALVLLRDADAPSATVLETEMGLASEAAAALFTRVRELEEEINLEKEVREFPRLEFGPKEVTVQFVTNLERTLRYADILRYALSANTEELNRTCPLRVEATAAVTVIPAAEKKPEEAVAEGVFADDDLAAIMGMGGGAKGEKVKATETKTTTYNYFNERVQEFDPELFDKKYYPKKCEKTRQVLVLTPEDEARIQADERMGEAYTYSAAPEMEKLALPLQEGGPAGTAICPPYWCMRDEIPLLEEQLVSGGAGGPGSTKRCPVCGGEVRVAGNEDPTTHTVVARDKAFKYPDIMDVSTPEGRQIRFPCCYKKPRAAPMALARKPAKAEEDDTYILSDRVLPARRLGYISEDLAKRLGIRQTYGETVVAGRLSSGKTDVFRVGLGRPSQTLPVMLGSEPVKTPKEAPEQVKQCSFYGTWTDLGTGDTQEERILDGIDAAFQTGRMSVLDEVEYVTRFLQCIVMRVNSQTNQLICGFWSDIAGAAARTIVLIDSDILAQATRRPPKDKTRFDFVVELDKLPFREGALVKLRTEYAQACASNLPSFDDAFTELQAQGKAAYEMILDPVGRAQAVLVPGQVILPFRPVPYKAVAGIPVRNSYVDVKDADLPTGDAQRAFLETARHPGFKVKEPLLDVTGSVVELLLESGFRVPIVPEEGEEGPAKEVVQTLRNDPERSLVSGEANTEDAKRAQEIAYAAEVAEFLLFSLSKDIAPGGPAAYRDLRVALRERRADLRTKISEWMEAEAYWSKSSAPADFINKVRTPCGQFTRKDACNKSSLCGWHRDTCKIRVKPVVEKRVLLNRIVKTLLENDKQRALVLDGRLSPFFSTILYLEMPHELITASL